MAERLSTRCSTQHSRQHLTGGRAAAAVVNSNQPVVETLRGNRDTADLEGHDPEHQELLQQSQHLAQAMFQDIHLDPVVGAQAHPKVLDW